MPDSPGLRAQPFYLITGHATCWKCGASTPVSRIALDGYEEYLGEGEWERSDDRSLMDYVSSIDSASMELVQQVAPWLRFGRSETADQIYLANHCTSCGVLQGDWFLSKPGEVFFPTDRSELQEFKVHRFEQRLEADGQCSWSAWHHWLVLPGHPGGVA